MTVLEAMATAAVIVPIALVSAYKSWQAEKQTRATGNGFAADVKATLARIEAQGERTERKIDAHLQAHADADVRRRA